MQHDKAGSWTYACTGRGTARSGVNCETVALQAIVGEEGTTHVAWTNPFPDAVTIDLSLYLGAAGSVPTPFQDPCIHMYLCLIQSEILGGGGGSGVGDEASHTCLETWLSRQSPTRSLVSLSYPNMQVYFAVGHHEVGMRACMRV
jgi:hypothetical protein